MKPTRLFWQLFPSYLLITVVAVLAITGYAIPPISRMSAMIIEMVTYFRYFFRST